MSSRAIHALFAIGMAAAIAVGAALGDGDTVVAHSHVLAFAVNGTSCPAGDAACAGLYTLNADSVPQDRIGTGRLPPSAKILVSGSDIVALSWSPDGTQIAYLVGRRALPRPNAYDSIELWRVSVDGTSPKLVAKNVASGAEQLQYRLGDAIRWIADQPGMSARATWNSAEYRELLSPDGKLVAWRQVWIDSNSICVTLPEILASRVVTDVGCFGDGFFTEPVWAPS